MPFPEQILLLYVPSGHDAVQRVAQSVSVAAAKSATPYSVRMRTDSEVRTDNGEPTTAISRTVSLNSTMGWIDRQLLPRKRSACA